MRLLLLFCCLATVTAIAIAAAGGDAVHTANSAIAANSAAAVGVQEEAAKTALVPRPHKKTTLQQSSCPSN